MDYLILLLAGTASGLIAGMVGFAGGIVIVPMLTWLYGATALQDAIVVSWFAVLFNSVVATHKQLRVRSAAERRQILAQSKYFFLGTLVVTPALAMALSSARGWSSPVLVGSLQLCLAVVMLWPIRESGPPRPSVNNRYSDIFFGGLVGGASVLIGTGGGVYTIAYFVHAAKRQFQDAIATANLTGMVIGLLSVAGYCLSMGYAPAGGMSSERSPISPVGMLLLVVSGIVFSSVGVSVSRRVPTQSLKKLMIAILIVSAVRLLMI